MARLFRYVAVVTAVLCLVSSAAAQGGAALRISVEDELGGAIKGAKLTLTHKASGETHEAASDKAGGAVFEGVSTGEYVLKAEAPGFLPLQRTVTVGIDQPPLKLKLQIEVTVEVTVTGVLLPERRTAADQNLDTIDLDNDLLMGLPLPMDPQQLSAFIVDFLSSAGGASEPTIVVDGLEVSSLGVPTAAIAHILVNKNPYSPEYRKPGKSRVEVITEDGSRSHFNANAGLTFAGSGLAARNAFALDKPDSHKDLTELGFSGPLINRVGQFVVSSQHLSDQQSRVVNAVTPAGSLVTTVPTFQDSTVLFGRADLKLTSADHLGIRYDFEQQLQRNTGVGGLRLPVLAANSRDTRNQMRFSLISKLSAASGNELKGLVERDRDSQGSQALGPKLVVQGAFESGSNQKFLANKSTTVNIQDTVTYFRRAHVIRFGGQLRLNYLEATDATNFGGTFQFANLDLFSTGQPSVFRISQGTPTVTFSRHEGELFFQDEVKLRPDLSLMAGARFDSQSLFRDRNNVGPRVAIAFAPGRQTTVLRAGAGIFYERLSDRIRQRSLLYDGVRTRELVISNPAYPDPFVTGEARTILPSIVRLAPGLTTPHLFQTSVSVEREVRTKTFLTVEYSHLRGLDLLRARNPNAPLPGTGVRPDPNVLNITQVESSGEMESNALTFAVRSRIGKVVKSSVIYTYARASDNTPGGDPFTLPADNFNLAAELGRADFDIRHKLNIASVLTLPHGVGGGAVLTLASGAPFDITTGFDDNHDTETTDRPFGVTRNTGQGPGLARLDLRFTKVFLHPRPAWSGKDNPGQVEINLDAFNALNRTNLGSPIGVLSSPFFGQSNSAKEPRTIQLSLKYRF